MAKFWDKAVDTIEVWQEDDTNSQTAPDLSYLRDMCGGDSEFIKEMILLFLDQTPLELHEMEKSYRESDFGKIKRLAHKLSSSFSLMGIKEGGTLRMLQEEASTVPDILLVGEKVNQLHCIFKESAIVLNNELKNQQSMFT